MLRKKLLYWIGAGMVMGIALTACQPAEPLSITSGGDVEGVAPTDTGPETVPAPADTEVQPTETSAPTLDVTSTEDTRVENESLNSTSCNNPFGSTRIRFYFELWDKTDFCKHSVDYAEISSGGPPPDGIPAIDAPAFETVADADAWLGGAWPVLFFELNGDARAYPLAILMWHEIVNDVVGGEPVTLTFCPLCNATIVFNRQLPDGTVLDFGTSGNLRNSDLIMYDRETQSWWQQFTGEGIVGFYTGTRLEFLPSQIIAWEDFKAAHPDGMVLSRDTGFNRNYGRNPYAGYDDINNNPFLFNGPRDGRLPATARVAAVEVGEQWKAYPFSELSQVGVVNDVVGGQPIVVFWQGNTASALDSSDLDDARIVGSTAVYSSEFDGQVLTFEVAEGGFRDLETGSLWNIFGEAVEGDLAGSQLEQIVSAEHFWFAWAAFRPDTLIWTLEE